MRTASSQARSRAGEIFASENAFADARWVFYRGDQHHAAPGTQHPPTQELPMMSWRILTQRHLPLGETVMACAGHTAYLSEPGHKQSRDRWRR
jgi:hypothetical protein